MKNGHPHPDGLGRNTLERARQAARVTLEVLPVERLLGPAARWMTGAEPPLTFEGEALRWSLDGDTLEVELHREPCNEIGSAALRELEQLAHLVRAGAGGARALLFHSSRPKGFCAGADLRELHDGIVARKRAGVPKAAVALGVRRFLERIHGVFDTFDTAPITTVAAVHGFCFGGGFELALTCDVIVADKSARFCFPEMRLGLVPGFGGVPRLQRDVGNAVVRDLLLTGRSLNASRAHQVGLVSQLVGRGQALEVARRVAAQASRFDSETTASAKRFLKPLPAEELRRERELFVRMFKSPTVEEALRRFVESDDVHSYLP